MAFRRSLSAVGRPLLRPSLLQLRAYAATPNKIDLDAAVTLQKARTWDEGEEGKFATSSLSEVFKGKKVVVFGLPGAFTGVCSRAHVPSYLNNIDALKSKGVDNVVCVAVNDPYVMKAWAKTLNADGKIDFYGDFDGSFHKMLDLSLDLTKGLLGPRSQRWSAVVENGEIKLLNVEEVPSEFKVSGGDHILNQL